MTILVWFLIGTALAFTTVVTICNVLGIQIQDSLITTFLGIIAAELATMGGIKIFKVKHPKKDLEDA